MALRDQQSLELAMTSEQIEAEEGGLPLRPDLVVITNVYIWQVFFTENCTKGV